MRKWVVWVPLIALAVVIGGALFARAHAAGMMGVGRMMGPTKGSPFVPPPVTSGFSAAAFPDANFAAAAFEKSP
jgi:hypothetical protein